MLRDQSEDLSVDNGWEQGEFWSRTTVKHTAVNHSIGAAAAITTTSPVSSALNARPQSGSSGMAVASSNTSWVDILTYSQCRLWGSMEMHISAFLPFTVEDWPMIPSWTFLQVPTGINMWVTKTFSWTAVTVSSSDPFSFRVLVCIGLFFKGK